MWGRRNEKCCSSDNTYPNRDVIFHMGTHYIIVDSKSKIRHFSQVTTGQARAKGQILTPGENSRKIQPDPRHVTLYDLTSNVLLNI